MERRYQVFVSSTFVDLEEERKAVTKALLKLRCLPAEMELFTAADEDQFDIIKKVIDECDYYVLILAGRYGSQAPDGVGYTEKEYDYAVSTNKHVLAFIHRSPGSITADKTETGPGRKKLEKFRNRVKQGRMASFYSDTAELTLAVSHSVSNAIRDYPQDGWVRGTAVNALQAEINRLKLKVQHAPQPPDADLSFDQDQYIMNVALTYYSKEAVRLYGDSVREPNILEAAVSAAAKIPLPPHIQSKTEHADIVVPVTWNEILLAIGDILLNGTYYPEVATRLGGLALSKVADDPAFWPEDCGRPASAFPDSDAYNDVIRQLLALRLITRATNGKRSEWMLTDEGIQRYVSMTALRKGL